MNRRKYFKSFFMGLAAAALGLGAWAPAFAAAGGGGGGAQASLTLRNCGSALCNFTDTAWSLNKTPDTQPKTGEGTQTIAWSVVADKVATSANMITVNGTVTIENTGTANATIGNIVINLQKKPGSSTGACRNVPWVSAAANVSTASSGDAATSANFVAAGSQEVQACNSAQGPGNYAVSGAQGTFTETTGSGSLLFTDASDNSVWNITPERVLAPGESVVLLYTATFNNTLLGLPAGTSVRAEAIVTFGNVNTRGGSGAAAQNIDLDGNGGLEADEVNVRSVPCRVTTAVPTLFAGNSTATLKDTKSDVTAFGVNVALSNFLTFNSNTGIEVISADATRGVSIDETCTPEGEASVFNKAHLDGTGSAVQVQIGQSCTIVGLVEICTPVYHEFTCVAAVALEDTARADVACTNLPDDGFKDGDYCTYTQGKYQSSANNPVANYLSTNFGTIPFPTPGATGIVRIGIEDGTGTKHDAEWNLVADFRNWIGGGGSSGALTADTLNGTSTSGGTLAKQTATLEVNLALSGSMPGDPAGLGSLQMCNLDAGDAIGTFVLTAAQASALNGKSINDIFADANNALGGNGLPSYVGSFGDLNQLVSQLNSGTFDDCKVGPVAEAYLCRPTQ